MESEKRPLIDRMERALANHAELRRELDQINEDVFRLRSYLASEERPRLTVRKVRALQRTTLRLSSRSDQLNARIQHLMSEMTELEAAIWPDGLPEAN